MATKISTPCRGSHGAPIAYDNPGWNAEVAAKENGYRAPGTQKQHKVKEAANNGIVGRLCTLVCNHQIGIAINLLSLLFLTHIVFPRARRRTSTFFRFSYYNPSTGQYGCGTDDLPFVALWMVIFTGLRAAVMDYVLAPLARLGGIKTRKGLARFQEQAWLICYCICSWSLGMYIMYHSEYWFNVHGLWKGWPFREIDGLSKFYYLVQWGFWVQQIVVVNIEEKRKDYAQMFTHHIFTCALLFLSYGYYHTRVGIVIMCLMDLVDIVLPSAKLLKYLGYEKVCDFFFAIFVLTWTVTRQIFFPIVCWSIYAHSPYDMEPGCYLKPSTSHSPNPQPTFIPASSAEFDALGGNAIWANILKAYTDREGPICWNPTIRFSFLSLLLSLQAIICLWFVMIVKVVYKVVRGQNADDVRSDDEDEADELEADPTVTAVNAAKAGTEWVPVEQEAGVESLTFASRKSGSVNGVSRRGRRSASRASGISIPGHSDRKELLGRIGCDKPS